MKVGVQNFGFWEWISFKCLKEEKANYRKSSTEREESKDYAWELRRKTENEKRKKARSLALRISNQSVLHVKRIYFDGSHRFLWSSSKIIWIPASPPFLSITPSTTSRFIFASPPGLAQWLDDTGLSRKVYKSVTDAGVIRTGKRSRIAARWEGESA